LEVTVMIETILGDGPNTFIQFWTPQELRAWFAEQDRRSKDCPGIYLHSIYWRDWIATEMHRRRLKESPPLLSDDERRQRVRKANRYAGKNGLRFLKVTVLVNGSARLG